MLDLNNTNKLYYSIKEVAAHFKVNESLLRFWEKEFEEIKPRKTESGVRQYTKKDIETIALIYSLVKDRGLTLEGARQILRTSKDTETRRVELILRLEELKAELLDLKDSFEAL